MEKMLNQKNKFLLWLLLAASILAFSIIYMFNLAEALIIIPEDPLENKSLEICGKIYNSTATNETLDCVNFLISLKGSNSSHTVIHNYTDDRDYIERRIEEKLVEKEFLTFDEMTNHIKEEVIRQLVLTEEEEEEDCGPNTKCAREFELRMKELELNEEPIETDAKTYSEEEFQKELSLQISEAISRANPPDRKPEPIPEEKDFVKYFALIIGVILIGYLGYKKLKLNQKPVYVKPPIKKKHNFVEY